LKDLDYAFAVARIRSLENSLMSNADIERLMACSDGKRCMQVLAEKGWGNGDEDIDLREMLRLEVGKTWAVLRDVSPDMSVFDVFSIYRLYHNLKAAIQLLCTEIKYENIYYEDAVFSGDELVQVIKEKAFYKLPYNMPKVAEEAYKTMLHTRDGQLCDVIVDRGAMETMIDLGQKSGVEIIKRYAEFTVGLANVKIALRAQETGKTLDFMLRALAPCALLDVNRLARAAATSREAIIDYLRGTAAGDSADLIQESSAAFERWCDNRLIEAIKSEKNKAFTAGPLAAYFVARQNEIKTVRLIVTGKQNKFPDEAIQERVRVMYA